MCCGFEVGVAWWRTSNNTLAAMDEGAGGGGTSAPPRTSKPPCASVLRSRCWGCGWRALGDDSRGCQADDPLLWRPWARWKAASTDTNQGSVAQRRDMILHTARNARNVTTKINIKQEAVGGGGGHSGSRVRRIPARAFTRWFAESCILEQPEGERTLVVVTRNSARACRPIFPRRTYIPP